MCVLEDSNQETQVTLQVQLKIIRDIVYRKVRSWDINKGWGNACDWQLWGATVLPGLMIYKKCPVIVNSRDAEVGGAGSSRSFS